MSSEIHVIGLAVASISRRVGSSTITDEEELVIKNYLPNSVTTGTAKGYSSGFRKWVDYIESLPSRFNTDIYLENDKDNREKAKRVVLFMVHLNEAKGLKDEQISKAIAALAYHFAGAHRFFQFIHDISRTQSWCEEHV
jgi:hypothetical protein